MTATADNSRAADSGATLSRWLAQRELDRVTLLVIPAVAFIILLFVYPFFYGLVLSLQPKTGDWLANYRKFFSDPWLYDTIGATLALAIPATIINVAISVPIAMRVRRLHRRRFLTTILVVPITLGTVLIAEGLLNYLGPQGWFNRALMFFGVIGSPVRLVHNYTGVMLSLITVSYTHLTLPTIYSV